MSESIFDLLKEKLNLNGCRKHTKSIFHGRNIKKHLRKKESSLLRTSFSSIFPIVAQTLRLPFVHIYYVALIWVYLGMLFWLKNHTESPVFLKVAGWQVSGGFGLFCGGKNLLGQAVFKQTLSYLEEKS